jgi:polar amino acid transport system permease protein
MNLRFEVVLDHFPRFLTGLWNTVWLSTLGMALALILGLLLLMPLIATRPIFQLLARNFVDTARSVPFLLLVYMVYYALPQLGLTLDSWTTAIVTIVGYNTAYIAEILRSAWLSIPAGQTEAGQAFGFSEFKLFRRIIAPQVLLMSGPMLGNQFIQIVKDSAFLAVITIPELTYAAQSIQSRYLVPFESFIVAALMYWLVCIAIEFSVQQVEKIRDGYVRY